MMARPEKTSVARESLSITTNIVDTNEDPVRCFGSRTGASSRQISMS